jgi:hypothetical protein
MRLGNRDRRTSPETEAARCAVCGSTDARLLSFTRLLGGERVPVCGSHKMAHHRSEVIAKTVDELRAIAGERRKAIRA